MNAKNEQNLKVMGLMEHLDELRGRISFTHRCCHSICGGLDSLSKFSSRSNSPLVQALPEGSNALHFTGPMDVLVAQIKISFLVAFIGACPVWLFQFWKFLTSPL